MVRVRPAGARGHFDHGWLDTYHTFSFAGYHDRAHMGFRALRVINEDRVRPGAGFGTHPHRDMEIVTYVLSGALAHRDSLGHVSVLKAGEIQRMSAGTGIEHSEFNASETEPVHLYQIWLFPDRRGLAPSYEQRAVDVDPGTGLTRIVSPDGRDGSFTIHQDAHIFLGSVNLDETVAHPIETGRHAWVQVVRGAIRLGEHNLGEGDGAAISEEESLDIRGLSDGSHLMIFDLA